jgi:Cu/Ag efflux protein CusF
MTRLSSLFGTLAVSTGLALAAANASAQTEAHDHSEHVAMAGASQTAPNALSEGEIKKVDKDSGKLTIKHGPLNNLGMPGMTMAFKVQDPAMLDQAKAGDQVRFQVERVNGTFTVTKLEASK